MLEKFNKKKAVLDMIMDRNSVCLIDENGELIMFNGNDVVLGGYIIILHYDNQSNQQIQDIENISRLSYDKVEQNKNGIKEMFMQRIIYYNNKLRKIYSIKVNKDNTSIAFNITDKWSTDDNLQLNTF